MANKTPYEVFIDQIDPANIGQYKSKISHFRVLSYKSYVYIPEKRRTKDNKLEKRIKIDILIKYKDTYIYRIYILSRKGNKIVRSSNVRFDERKGLITEKKGRKNRLINLLKKLFKIIN